MTEKVTLVRRDNLPMPLIFLASPEDWADWYAHQLLRSLEQGEHTLSISCFDTAGDFDAGRTAQAVLKAVTDVLYEHPEAEDYLIIRIVLSDFLLFSGNMVVPFHSTTTALPPP